MIEYYSLVRQDILEFFFTNGITIPLWLVDTSFGLIVILSLYVIKPLIRAFNMLRLKRNSVKYFDPYYLPSEIIGATANFVNTHFQNIPPSHEHEPSNTHAATAREPLIPFFFRVFRKPEVSNKYYIILADSGMGKTTFLINLYYQYKIKLFRKYDIFLFPLGAPGIEFHVRAIPDDIKCRSIMLFDALDEDPKASTNYVARIDTLMQLTHKFRFVLITCRTQFFPFEEAEPSEINIRKNASGDHHRFKKIYLSPFTDLDIAKYLLRRFSLLRPGRIFKARKIIKSSPYLMVRPMLLSYIDDLINIDKDFDNVYEIYRFLIHAWIDREGMRKKATEREQFKGQLKVFSEKIAIKLYQDFFNDDGLSISGNEILSFAKEYNIVLEDLELKSKSLLNRDGNGRYKFAHKSILEYFLAVKAYQDFEFYRKFKFQSFTYTKKLYRSLCEGELKKDLAIREKYQPLVSSNSRDQRVLLDTPDAKLFQLACGIRKITALRAIDLRISDDYVHYLKVIDELRELDLSGNSLREISVLYELQNLEQLRICRNKIEQFFIHNFPRLTVCDVSSNFIRELNLDSDNLEHLNISKNPLQSVSFSAVKRLKRINLTDTKIAMVPKFPDHVIVMHDDDFTFFLNRTEQRVRKNPIGAIKLLKSEEGGLFNRCIATKSYCEYSYVDPKPTAEKIDAFDFIDDVNTGVVSLIGKLVFSCPKANVDNQLKAATTNELVNYLKRGVEINIDHPYSNKIEILIEQGVIRMRIFFRH